MIKHSVWAAAASLALVSFASVAHSQNYTQVNLVANKSGVAPVTDPNLVNPWGISRSSGSPWWVSDAGTGLSTLYNGAGVTQGLVVTIPKNPGNTSAEHGSPSGTVFNGSKTNFILATGKPAAFLFCTLDGTIAAWNPNIAISKGGKAPSTNAVSKVVTHDGSVYTGMTLANIGAKTYLYAANFTKGRVDVFNSAFQHTILPQVPNGDSFNPGLEAPFVDALLPSGYSPYNVQAIGDDIVVTYAPSNFTAGPGNGFADIYSSAGELLKRIQSGAWMNAPWGIALAPTDFGTFSHALLIGQFGFGGSTSGAGTIAAFDLYTGNFLGQVEDSTGKPIVINGLWAISDANGASAGSSDPAGAPAAELYFAAGPNGEQDGLLGYLKPVATELLDGNDQ